MGENNIKYDSKNYRKHTEKNLNLIKKSLKECGTGRSIVIDNQGEIIAGNATYQECLKANIPVKIIETDGKELIALKRTDLKTDDEKRKKLALLDNSTSDKVEWDIDNLSADFDLSNLEEFGIEGLQGFEETQAEIVEDEVPEEVETKCKTGDIWQLGEHRLMCGDSTVITDVEKLMNGEKADLLLTDPPYNVNYEGGNGLKIENDNMGDEKFKEFLKEAFTCANIVMKEGASFYIWHADSEGYNFRSACKEVGLQVRQCLIWNKNALVMGRQDYQWKHEPCLYGWKEGAAHTWLSDRKQTTVLEFDRPTRSLEHPTMKPVALFAYEIQNSANKGGLVLDLFGGSGTTIIACEQLNRKCYTMELDPHYCDVIITRWEKLTGKEAKLCK